jgi:hypothetical protein
MQDFFESRLLSMDTDFRMFSGDYLGRLPGIDIAQVLDGAAYHSHHDTIDRIRSGTIQVKPRSCNHLSWLDCFRTLVPLFTGIAASGK